MASCKFSKYVKDNKRILYDLFVTIENIIKGRSSVTREECDTFISYKVDPPENQPSVFMLYDKSNETKSNSNLEFNQKEVGHGEKRSCLSANVAEPLQETERLVSYDVVELKPCIVDLGVASTSNTLNDKRVADGSESTFLKMCSEHAEVLNLKKEIIVDNAQVANNEMQFFQEDIAEIEEQQIDLEANGDEVSVRQICSLAQNSTKDDSSQDEKSNGHSLDTEEKQMANDDSRNKSNVCANNTKALKMNTPKESRKKRKVYKCNYCDKPFAFVSNKVEHERIHTGEKPFKCRYCDKAFTQKSSKKVHERIHRGEKPYTCNYCNKSFNQVSAKRVHERIHTGEKPFACDFCNKKFSQVSHKDNHERLHTGGKPYHCEYCEKAFRTRSHKIQHERTHTGEKPYSCAHCNKKFKRGSNKKDHEKRIHKK